VALSISERQCQHQAAAESVINKMMAASAKAAKAWQPKHQQRRQARAKISAS